MYTPRRWRRRLFLDWNECVCRAFPYASRSGSLCCCRRSTGHLYFGCHSYIILARHIALLLLRVRLFILFNGVFTIYCVRVFCVSDVIGSPRKLLELLETVAETAPVDGNYHGSYMTFRSRPGAIFAVQASKAFVLVWGLESLHCFFFQSIITGACLFTNALPKPPMKE